MIAPTKSAAEANTTPFLSRKWSDFRHHSRTKNMKMYKEK